MALASTETYASVAEADTYHANHGNTAWDALDDPTKEIALRNAVEYLDSEFWDRWQGLKAVPETQVLDWPRSGATDSKGNSFDNDEIPTELKNAQSILALKAITEALSTDLEIGGSNLKVKEIGSIVKEWFAGTNQKKIYTLAVNLIQNILIPGSGPGTVKLIRT